MKSKYITQRIITIQIIGWLLVSIVSGQIPSNPIGSNPLSIKWDQIENDRVQLIYPDSIEPVARRIAGIIDQLWYRQDPTIGDKNIRVPILIHTHRVSPNGFVIPGPLRSEFFAIPGQFKNLTNYVDQLTIHEYRHVVQFANADRGISGLAKDVLGSWVWGGFAATAWPRWYWEGDAVIAETEQTLGGRGRFPAFNMEYHALLHEGIQYSYEKAAAGSLKDFVPDWYRLGYNMLSYGRKKYGRDLWQKVSEESVRYKGIFYPFGKSLKKHTGISIKDLYEESMDYVAHSWKEIDSGKKDASMPVDRPEKSTVIHYNSAIPLNKDQLIALKSGYNTINHFAMIYADGSEERLLDLGLLPDREMTTITHNNHQLYWSEQSFHPRWRNETYYDVYSYHINTGVKRQITSKGRYLSPDVSPDGNEIVAISLDKYLRQSLVLLESSTGKEVKRVHSTSEEELCYPRYLDENTILYISNKDQKNAIFYAQLSDGSIHQLTPYTYQHLAHLTVTDGRIVVSMADDHTHEIYEVSFADGTLKQLTNSIIGAYQPTVYDKKLYFSRLTSKGFDIYNQPIIRNIASDSRSSVQENLPLFYPKQGSIDSDNILAVENQHDHKSSSFSPWSGLLNFHSILPEWTPPEVSLTALSDNAFGTLSGTLTGNYNYNEEEFSYGAGVRYAALYPIFNTSFTRANRSAVFYQFEKPEDTMVVQSIFIERWKEDRATFGVTVPYNFTKGSTNRQLSIGAQFQSSAIGIRSPIDNRVLRLDTISGSLDEINRLNSIINEPIRNERINTIDLRFGIQILKFQAIQHLRPKLGWTLNTRYRHNLSNQELGGHNFAIRSLLYLPGIMGNHSLSFDGMYMQENLLSNYKFSDVFVYPRGYDFSLRRDKFFRLAVNYRFPIAYPDIAMGGFAFLKRLKGNAFFDYGRFTTDSFPFQPRSENISSVGFELGLDFRALRLVEVDLGVRYSYLLNSNLSGGQPHQFDFFVISITE